MKPIRLTMEAFGAFAEKQEVDFTRFKGIFLISGPTGSGKTTIFDAMTFALYGELPGTRVTTGIKSDYTGPDKLCRVIFEFSIGGNSYKIERHPPQERNKAKGEGTTNDDEQVEFYRLKDEEWKPETGTKTVINKKINELVKLTQDEFSRIILLPQGEFQKFLEADTKEKSTILEKVFPIEVFSRIAWNAKEKAKKAFRADRYLKDQLKELQEKFCLDRYAEDLKTLDAELSLIREEKTKLDDERISLAQRIADEKHLLNDIIEHEKLVEKRDKALQDKPKIEEQKKIIRRAELASPLKSLLDALKVLQADYRQEETKKTELKSRLDAATGSYQKAEEQLKHTLDKLTKNLEEQEDLKEYFQS
ncbi:MAG: SMC family ATPase, partial [Fibrobacteria bacterium]|nr:SMC family ATPase [Fibrobacteria bacterium]